MGDETIEELREAWQASRENNRRLADTIRGVQAQNAELKERIEELADQVPHPGDGSCDRCGCVPSVDIPTALCTECLELLTSTEALQAENKLQAKRIEELEEWQRQMVAKAADESLDGYREMAAKCVALEEQKDKLKEENATLRATAELVETALRDYVLAQSRMSDRWAESDKAVKHQLWRDLHVCEALGREALEALENASATQPTTNPRSSGGSGT